MAVYQATATGTTTTTSASYTPLDSMTLTPGVAGDYIVAFTSSIESPSQTRMFFSMFVDGVQVAHTERVFYAEGSITNRANNVSIYALVENIDATSTIDIRWYRDTAGTVVCYDRTLTMQEVDAIDVDQATATADTNTTSTTDVLLNSMTVTPGDPGDYIVYFSSSMYGPSQAQPTFSIYVGGVQVAHSERSMANDDSVPNTEYIVTTVAGVQVSDSTSAVEIRWRAPGGTTVNAHERTLVVQRVNEYFQASATVAATTTSATDVLMTGMELTPGAGDYLAFFTTGLYLTTNLNQMMQTSLYNDGVQVGHTLRYTMYDASYDIDVPCANSINAYLTNIDSTTTLDIRWNTAGGTATTIARTFVMIPAAAFSSSSSSRSSSSSSSSSSLSSSSSSSSATPGTVTYGHHTGVEETYSLNFSQNTSGWTISGTPGNDNEAIDATSCGEIVTFDPHYLGSMTAIIRLDKYLTGYGPTPVVQYKTAATNAGLPAASWNVYNGTSFVSLGWIRIRFIH